MQALATSVEKIEELITSPWPGAPERPSLDKHGSHLALDGCMLEIDAAFQLNTMLVKRRTLWCSRQERVDQFLDLINRCGLASSGSRTLDGVHLVALLSEGLAQITDICIWQHLSAALAVHSLWRLCKAPPTQQSSLTLLALGAGGCPESRHVSSDTMQAKLQ